MNKIEITDKKYPDKLRKIPKAPKELYVEGNIENLNNYCIAIVGSRNCTPYGERWCKYFVKELVKYNLTIVSGMAIGIDTIAHIAALNAGGKTIAVLPSGLKNIYPECNKKLYERILKSNGTAITEYSPETKANSRHFLERNRIVSGLSIATLVIEAAFRSGTSVTAGLALSQERDVYCIPGNIDNSKSIGTNELIKKGAFLVTCPEDIIQNYDFLHKVADNEILKNANELDLLDIRPEYKNIYKSIKEDPLTVNEIAKLSKENLKEVMAKLTMLELDGKVKRLSGNRFIRNVE